MAKISAPQLKVLMTLAHAEAAGDRVRLDSLPTASVRVLAARDLIGDDGRYVWLDRNEVNAALYAEYSAADDKRYRHESRCKACNAGADCATGDKLFHAAGDAFDAMEAFENVFKPFSAQYRTAGGEWRPFMSDGRNALHFARRADAEEYAATQSAFPVTRILRDGIEVGTVRVAPRTQRPVWVDDARADAICDAYDAHQAEMAAQDADVSAGALTDATVERCGTANPVGTYVCAYSAAHAMRGVPAVTVIDCGPVGIVDACQACADFYARMQSKGDGLDDLRALLTF